jgi:hypothetical protein
MDIALNICYIFPYNSNMKILIWLAMGMGLLTAVSVFASSSVNLTPQQSSNQITWVSETSQQGNLLALQGSIPANSAVSYRGQVLSLTSKRTFQLVVPNITSKTISFTITSPSAKTRIEKYTIKAE